LSFDFGLKAVKREFINPVNKVRPGIDKKPIQAQTVDEIVDAVMALREGARFLLLAARPLHEPVVQYGPFVMNTRQEIEQTLKEIRDGTFITA